MSVWATLGLERTSDIAEIRRAYARKLKATDVDADAGAFVALRQALERALAEAQRAAGPARPTFDTPSAIATDDAVLRSDEGRGPAEGGRPEPAPGEDPDARFRAFEQLLFPRDDASPPDPDALAATLRAILDHPDMAQVDRSRRTEMWLAEAACRAIPRSDPIAPLLVRHFQWAKNQGRIDQPPMFDVLIARARGQDLLALIADPEHPMHEAYRSLLGWGPEVDFGLARMMGRDVRKLLKVIRERAPAAESSLDRNRVAQWDAHLGTTPRQLSWEDAERGPQGGAAGGGKSPAPWIFGVIILLLVSRMAACVATPPY